MNTADVIANICIIGLEIIGLSKSISGRGLKIWTAALICLIGVISAVIKFIAP